VSYHIISQKVKTQTKTGLHDTVIIEVVRVCDQVKVGNLIFKLGQLKYQKLDGLQTDTEDQWTVVMVAAACGGTLVALIIIVVAVYKRKSSRAERQFTKLQVQLDALETNIRHECKQGWLVS